MLSTLAKISDCIGLPYFILGWLSLLILAVFKKKRKKTILFIVFFPIIWRSAFYILSSRYCAIFLLLIPYIVLIFSNRLRNIKAGIIAPVVIALIAYNILGAFLSFSNLYICDAKEGIDLFLSDNDNSPVMITDKEFYRLKKKNRNNQFVLDSTHSNSKKLDYLCQQKPWNQSIYWIDYCKKKNEPPIDYIRQFDLFSIKQICSLITSAQKTKRLSFYKIDSKLPEDTVKIQNWLKNNASLEAYSPLCNTYVFCNNKKIFWFIGIPIEDETEIIYNLFAIKPNLLPENRIKSGYDYRGCLFRKNRISYKEFDSYIVLEREIPQDYPIKRIDVGLNKNGTISWRQSIILSNAL